MSLVGSHQQISRKEKKCVEQQNTREVIEKTLQKTDE